MTEREFKIDVLPYSRKVYPLAYRMLGSRHAAQDAIQQAMLRLWERRSTLKGSTNMQALVFTVVRNICLDELKKKRPVAVEEPGKIVAMSSDLPAEQEKKEAVRIIGEIVEQLPEQQREVITLRDMDGLEFDEIATIMNIEVTYVRVLLSRARKTVREKMEKIYAYEAIRAR
jgi:RNA polymerase sigma factor (sigma-70 family)